jgi:hypothetical protein
MHKGMLLNGMETEIVLYRNQLGLGKGYDLFDEY